MPTKAASPKPTRARGSARAGSGDVYITRQVHFNAAHRLHNPAYGEAWNERQYGRCASPRWHGHNYVLEATVRGRPNPATGYVFDLIELKGILRRAVAEPCDHRNLNEDVGFLRGVIPSTENLVVVFWREIERHLAGRARLHRVRLYETPRHFADYLGP